MPAHNDVHLRLVEHVPEVQPARHIRRRQKQREHWTRLTGRRSRDGEQLFLDPVLGPARFNRARLVRFGKLVRHVRVGTGARPSMPSAARLFWSCNAEFRSYRRVENAVKLPGGEYSPGKIRLHPPATSRASQFTEAEAREPK